MEGEQFESANVESQPMEEGGYAQESSSETYEGSEGSAYDSSDGGYEEGSNESSETSERTEETIASARSDEGTSFELYTDPVTGKTEFRVRGPQEENEEEYEEDGGDNSDNSSQEEGQTQEGLSAQYGKQVEYNATQQPKYTLDEFSYALANGIVDGTRVPDEYQAQYAEYKIAQAQQAFNQRAQMEAQKRQQLEQQMQAQQSPEARIEANKKFFESLEQEATRFAMADLGITEEDLANAEYEEDGGAAIQNKLDSAKSWHKQRLMNELQARRAQEEAYKAQQKQLYQEIGDFTRNAQMNEPHFQEIDKMLSTAWQEMPTKYGAIVQGALQSLAQGTITRQQTQVIQKYYEDVRRLFYARQNGLQAPMRPQQKKRPPSVERAGNGQSTFSSKAPDYKALRNADARGKKAWLGEFFKGIEL